MTSYRLVALPNDKFDRNQNITQQPDVTKVAQVIASFSDDEDREDWERSPHIRGRSQSLKNLNERGETVSISRSKSLRDVDTGDNAGVRARVSYVDSWNPVNPVGRGKIAERVKSWENNLDVEEDSGRRNSSSDSGMDRQKFSGSSQNGTRAGYDHGYSRNGSRDWRDERYESYQTYSQDTAEYADDNYRVPDHDQVR